MYANVDRLPSIKDSVYEEHRDILCLMETKVFAYIKKEVLRDEGYDMWISGRQGRKEGE